MAITPQTLHSPDRETPATLHSPCGPRNAQPQPRITGGIQPGILRRLIGQEHRDNGLLARLLLAWPDRRPRQWTEAETPPELTGALQRVYDGLWALTPDIDSRGDPSPRSVRLSDAAKRSFVAFVNDHGAEQYQLDGEMAAAWSKLEGYALRLALIHHCVRCTYEPTLSPDIVDDESMQAGIALVRWFGTEDRRIYGAMSETETDAQRRELVELIRRHKGHVTTRDLMRSTRRYGTAEEAEKALMGLVPALGSWQQRLPSPRGGQPTREFCLHER